MFDINHVWLVTGTQSSGGLTAVEVVVPALESVLYCEASTLASTQSFSFQTAQNSSGPWFTEASTSVSAVATAGSCDALRLTGPFQFVRPRLNSASTGTYTFRLLGVA